MDIQRKVNKSRKKAIRIIFCLAGLLVVVIVTIGLMRLEPAAPSVDRQTLLSDTVRRGNMTLAVRGVGTLVSEDMLVVPALVSGRIVDILIEPGTAVEPETVIYELSNPELHLRYLDAESALSSAKSRLRAEKARLRDQLLGQQANLAQSMANLEEARLRYDVQAEQYENGLISELQFTVSSNNIANRERLLEIQNQRLEVFRNESMPAQLASLEAAVVEAESEFALRKSQEDSLKVRAGVSGMLAPIRNRIELGQRVAEGQILARITNPDQLKAQLQVPQGQARDISLGLPAAIDTYNGIVAGRVSRIEPTVVEGNVLVDISLEKPLPSGARPEASVVGTIEIARLENILYVGRPVMVSENSRSELFRINDTDPFANRVPVQFGRSSVSTMEVIDGLVEGDRVVLSDMSEWDQVERIKLK